MAGVLWDLKSLWSILGASQMYMCVPIWCVLVLICVCRHVWHKIHQNTYDIFVSLYTWHVGLLQYASDVSICMKKRTSKHIPICIWCFKRVMCKTMCVCASCVHTTLKLFPVSYIYPYIHCLMLNRWSMCIIYIYTYMIIYVCIYIYIGIVWLRALWFLVHSTAVEHERY